MEISFSFQQVEQELHRASSAEQRELKALEQARGRGLGSEALARCRRSIEAARRYRDALETICDCMRSYSRCGCCKELALVYRASALLREQEPLGSELLHDVLALPARARREAGLRLAQLSATFLAEGGARWRPAVFEIAALLERIDASFSEHGFDDAAYESVGPNAPRREHEREPEVLAPLR